MKLLHTSDWHLGKRLEGISRLPEQQAALQEICSLADEYQVDAVIISGDLYDTFNPPTEAIELFYKTLKILSENGKRLVLAIAGNHDSPDRIDSPDPLARECGIVFIGYPNAEVPEFELPTGLKVSKTEKGLVEFKLPNTDAPLRIIHTPYANEFRLKTCLDKEDDEQELRDILSAHWKDLADSYCDNKGVNLLVTHLFFNRKGMELQAEPEDEKPILHIGGAQAFYPDTIPTNIQYVALGHLHRKQVIDSGPCPVVYSGSPIAYSFAECNQDKYVLLLDMQPGKEAKMEEVKLNTGKRLLRHRAESQAEALRWLQEHPHCLVELTLVSDNFITAADRKQLHDIHAGIVSIIPEIQHDGLVEDRETEVDLTKKVDDLFADYFLHVKGQLPNERITALFKEILAEEENE